MIIIAKLTIDGIVTAKGIMSYVKECYDILISPGTVYPVLYRIEHEGYIKMLPNRRKKIYIMTEKGHSFYNKIIEVLMTPKFQTINVNDCLAEIKKRIV
jgi:DNA-binding PadR family transcriptional regulator